MATASSLITEIAEILQEDFTLSEQWTQTELLNLLNDSIREISVETLGRDFKDIVGIDYSGVTVPLSDKFIGGFHARTFDSRELEIEDIQLLGLMTGITNPNSIGTPKIVGELYSAGNRCYRFYPRYNTTGLSIPNASQWTTTNTLQWTTSLTPWASGTTVQLWYKAEFQLPSALTSSVRLSDWFVLPVKFRTLANAFTKDTDLQDTKKAEAFSKLSTIMTDTLRTLY